jgi:PAS domain S-box-containing protein
MVDKTPSDLNMEISAWVSRERGFGRIALQGAAVLAGLGAAFGAFLGGPGVLTPVEYYFALAFMPLALLTIIYVQMRPDTAVNTLAYPIVIVSWIYIVGDTWSVALLKDDPKAILVHLAWTTPLSIFAFILIPRLQALAASAALTIMQAAAVAAMAYRISQPPDFLQVATQTVWIIAQGVSLALIFGVSRFMEASLTERAAAIVQLENVAKLQSLLEHIQQQRDRYRRLIEASLDVFLELRPDGTIAEISPNCQKIIGYTREEIIGTSVFEITVSKSPDSVRGSLLEVVKGHPTVSLEQHVRAKSGAEIPIAASAVYSPQDDIVFVIIRDLRERVAQEERERHASRLEALGQLTGGIAHDFNNLLTVMYGEIERMEHVIESRGMAGIDISRLQRAADGAFDLTRRLLAFSRKEPLHLASANLKLIIDRSVSLLASSVGKGVRLRSDSEDVWARVDAPELQAAIINLIVNARDAMPEGGEIVLTCAGVDVAETIRMPWSAILPGRYAVIQVQDGGVGIDRENLPKIIEPYFTTKGLGKGTGLGLSMASKLAEKLGGGLAIESAPGAGTRVSLYIPRE